MEEMEVAIRKCENIILAFQKMRFTLIYNAKAKAIKTTATKRAIENLFKKDNDFDS